MAGWVCWLLDEVNTSKLLLIRGSSSAAEITTGAWGLWGFDMVDKFIVACAIMSAASVIHRKFFVECSPDLHGAGKKISEETVKEKKV
ncbi:hypothetical protein FH972_008805 [Carpinus fangiana]|uniref:Uncharacterized protein n=1 Tax=Carpinus fangiana TaxID=176857 RepID=A0A5N6QZS7_9ROSI|nr:hypothetical protein FH972_008805 [Carpinus fangiana]